MAPAKYTGITNLDLAEEQVIFYRSHLDVFIEDAFSPIKLTRDQHVIARSLGNCADGKVVQSRGSGKTWLIALIAFAICCLYPGTIVAVCSGTAGQATLILQKLKLLVEQNPNMANELTAAGSRSLVQLSKDKGKCTFKNGSFIESFAIDSMRGIRAKIVIVDETPEVDQETQDAVVSPIKNYRREISFNYGFQDYESKTIAITSACEKSNSFYDEFLRVVRNMAKGDRTAFACALDYNAAAANGITTMDFFMKEKERMPDLVFQMEYGSKFVGATSNSAFPYELTNSCRTLEKIEMEQPKNSKSFYIISLDIATSEDKNADNSIICVVKYIERSDGTFSKKLVNMRSYHGKKLDVLAEEIRKLYHTKFPNAAKIVYDSRGLGDSLDRFFDKEWVDPLTGKEYPPLVVDDVPQVSSAAIKVLHPFRAVQSLNQRIYTNLRVALEKRTIELPINSRIIQSKQNEIEDPSKRMTMQESAVYLETDALVFEMGNIVAKVGKSGNVLYDTPRANQHKDRYSALAMANDYICELEKENVKKYKQGDVCIGIASGL